MSRAWDYTETDRRLAAELEAWLPPRVFDVHAHLYRRADHARDRNAAIEAGPEEATVAVWRSRLAAMVGASRAQGALFIPFPSATADPERANEFVVSRLEAGDSYRGSILVGPESSRKKAERHLSNPRVVGLKPYHVYSPRKPTFQAPVESFLPDWAWELAEERRLAIVLHLVKERALDDPENLSYITRMCERHGAAQLVLAHAGRGFHAPNTVKAVGRLRGLENVWFDSSAICEAEPLLAVLSELGPRRLLWGSDFPVSEMRGRAVTVGDGFVWLQDDTVAWDKLSPACSPTLVGIESLAALRRASDLLGLGPEDLEDIFWRNARRLLGMEEESGRLTQELYERAKRRIPGGTHLLSKRPEMLAPGQWPAYFREARGCETWDLDGKHYYDMSSNGIGACLLGFRHPEVTRAVRRRIELGSMCTLNPPEEVEVADELCRLHPWADKVRLTRTGGETAVVAVRIARATTDRSVVAISGYSGWHDWYLAANLGVSDALRGHLLPGLQPLGVPRELRGTALTFTFGSRSELDAIVDAHGDRLAAVVMEPCRHRDPEPGYLEYVRDRAHRAGALLLFDEITIGFRLRRGGSHLGLGVEPDIAFFAKALGNGHPCGAVIGTKQAMDGAEASFISSTYWTESVGPAAALATLRALGRTDVPAHVAGVGGRIKGLWREIGKRRSLPVAVDDGYPCLAHFRFDHPEAEALRTLYTQLMLERGFLAGVSIYPTLAHTAEIVERYAAAIDEVFGRIAGELSAGTVRLALKGPVAHSGFARLN